VGFTIRIICAIRSVSSYLEVLRFVSASSITSVVFNEELSYIKFLPWHASIFIRIFWFCIRFCIVVFMKDIKSIILFCKVNNTALILFGICPIFCWKVILFGLFELISCSFWVFWEGADFGRWCGSCMQQELDFIDRMYFVFLQGSALCLQFDLKERLRLCISVDYNYNIFEE